MSENIYGPWFQEGEERYGNYWKNLICEIGFPKLKTQNILLIFAVALMVVLII